MRHRKRTVKLGRRPDHVRQLLANQVCSLILEGQIRTTVARAKATKQLAEKMVTLGKRGTLHHRRLAVGYLHQRPAVRKLFSEIAPQFMDRAGGYTRLIHLGQRLGDAADMCLLQWVGHEFVPKAPKEAREGKEAEEAAEKPEKEKDAAAAKDEAKAEKAKA